MYNKILEHAKIDIKSFIVNDNIFLEMSMALFP